MNLDDCAATGPRSKLCLLLRAAAQLLCVAACTIGICWAATHLWAVKCSGDIGIDGGLDGAVNACGLLSLAVFLGITLAMIAGSSLALATMSWALGRWRELSRLNERYGKQNDGSRVR